MHLSEVSLGFKDVAFKQEPTNKVLSDPGDAPDCKDIVVDSKDAVGEYQLPWLQKVPGNTGNIEKLQHICHVALELGN